jgi:hypothetical protein
MSDLSASPILLAPSLGEYFRNPVRDALAGREVDASPAAEGYLVHLLSDFAKPVEAESPQAQAPATFRLHDALTATGSERFARLQRLGDSVLYELGFFGQRLQETDHHYLVHVGASAYQHAASMVAAGTPHDGLDLFRELSTRFSRFVDVLVWVSDWLLAQSARGERGLVVLFERWLRTRSTVLRDELAQRGLTGLDRLSVPH